MKWILPTLLFGFFSLLVFTSCSSTEFAGVFDNLFPPGQGRVLPLPERGVQVHPNGATQEDINEACRLFSVVRINAPKGVEQAVDRLIVGSNSNCRFNVLLGHNTSDEMINRWKSEPKIIAFELENEVDGFLGWSPALYDQWAREWFVRHPSVGSHQRLVSVASISILSGEARSFTQGLVDLRTYELFDIVAIHLYGKRFKGDPKGDMPLEISIFPEIKKLLDDARSQTQLKKVWVTEFGSDTDQIAYFRQMPSIFEFYEIPIDMWFIYAWTDDVLHYTIKGTDFIDFLEDQLLGEVSFFQRWDQHCRYSRCDIFHRRQ